MKRDGFNWTWQRVLILIAVIAIIIIVCGGLINLLVSILMSEIGGLVLVVSVITLSLLALIAYALKRNRERFRG